MLKIKLMQFYHYHLAGIILWIGRIATKLKTSEKIRFRLLVAGIRHYDIAEEWAKIEFAEHMAKAKK